MVPANKVLFARTVPANKVLFSRTVLANKVLFSGTVHLLNNIIESKYRLLALFLKGIVNGCLKWLKYIMIWVVGFGDLERMPGMYWTIKG